MPTTASLRMTRAALVLALTIPNLATGQLASEDPQRRKALDHYQTGKALMRAERWEEAEPEFRQALHLDPQLVMAYYDLGQTLMALKRPADAVVAYRDCQKAYRQAAEDEADREATAQQTREDQIRGFEDDIRLLRHDMGQLPAGSAAAQQVQRTIDRIRAQIDALERLRGVKAGSIDAPPELSLALGSAYFRSGDMDQAEHAYLAALQAKPKLGEAHNNLAVIYLRTGRLEEAEKAIRRAEKDGYRVHPQLKKDVAASRQAGRP